MHLSRELALQGAQRRSRCLGRAAVDQVRDGLRLRQVDPVVQERSLREFARSGLPGAEFENAPQQDVEHHRSAVALKLKHVFTGQRVRRGKVERQALVDRVASGVEEIPQRGQARWRQVAQQRRGDRPAGRTRDADDADAAPAWRRGDRGDRVGLVARHGREVCRRHWRHDGDTQGT